MFAKYNTSTLGHGGGQHFNSASAAGRLKKTPSDVSQAAERKVFVGRMGVDEKSADSIPNAWMASTPGHPFWLQPMEVAEEMAALRGMQPEQMTGPIALYDQIKRYNDDFEAGRGDGGIKLDEHYATSGWRHLYKSSSVKSLARARQSLVILPHYEVYPFSWQRDGDMFKQYCTSSGETFDAKKCKALLGLEHWGSHSITYWSHSWSGDGSGHWEEHLEAMNNSNDPEIEKETVEKKGDERKDHEKTDDKNRKERADATEANRKAEEAKKQGDDKKKAQERSTILISNGRGKRR